MKSVTLTVPLIVSQIVSRISVPSSYLRLTSPRRGSGPSWAVGLIRHCPFFSSPSRAAKQASESNRGRHSQSTEPCRSMSAAVCMSPISA